MNKKSLLLILSFATLLSVSCGKNSQNDSDVATVDSTAMQENLEQEEINEMASVINGVSECLDSIQMQEHMIFNAKEGTTNKQKILEQLKSFKELLARKESQINALMAKNKNMSSSDKKTIQNLQKMVNYLSEQLVDKSKQVESLQESVQRKDAKIDELRYSNNELSNESEYLKEQNYQQDKQLNTCYYVVGSKSELKEAGLLKTKLFSKKVNSENIDKKLFKQIDKRSFKKLVIDSKSPKIFSNNPPSSYTITKNDDGTSTLEIIDSEKFWGVSSFLIIQK